MPTPIRALVFLLAVFPNLAALGAGRELAPRVLAPTTYATTEAHVAFAGDRFLTIWREGMGDLGSPMMAALSDSDGRRISERAVPLDLPPITDSHSIRLIGAGDGFALFWQSTGESARVALIDRDRRVTEIRSLELPRYQYASFASNGTHFLAVITRGFNPRGEAFVLDRDGRAVHGPIAVPEYTSGTDIAVVSRRFVLVSSGAGAVYARTIADDGATESTLIAVLHGTGSFAVAGVDANEGMLVVWSVRNGNQDELKSAIRRADGTVTPPQTIATDAGSISPIEVLAAAEGYVVAFRTEASGRSPARWVVRLDAAGAKATEPLQFGEPAVWRTSAAAGAAPGKVMLLAETPRARTIAIGADAQPRTPEWMSIRPSRQTQPILSAGGGRVLAAWTEIAPPAAAVRGATLDASGERLALTHIAPAFGTANELAWNGVHHLVVHRDLTRLMATRVTADGVAVDAEPIVLEPFAMYGWNRVATVAWTGNQWIVVWSDREQLRMVKVSRGGVASMPRPLPVHPPLPTPNWSREVEAPSIASDGKRVLLIWPESHREPCYLPGCDIRERKTLATRLTPDGEPFGNALELETGYSSLSIASSGEEFMVLAGPRAFVVIAGEPALRVASTREVFGVYGLSDVTWDGREYVVAIRYRLVEHYLALIRLDRDGKPVTAPRGTRTLRPDWGEQPSVAAPFAGVAIIGVQEGTVTEGVSAAVYVESDLSALSAPPAPPRNVRVQRVNASYHVVTWDPSSSGDAEIYTVEVQAKDGQWYPAASVPSHLLTAVVYTFSDGRIAVRVRAVNAGGPSEPAEPITPAKRRSVR